MGHLNDYRCLKTFNVFEIITAIRESVKHGKKSVS